MPQARKEVAMLIPLKPAVALPALPPRSGYHATGWPNDQTTNWTYGDSCHTHRQRPLAKTPAHSPPISEPTSIVISWLSMQVALAAHRPLRRNSVGNAQT